jgi:hypothetical protein
MDSNLNEYFLLEKVLREFMWNFIICLITSGLMLVSTSVFSASLYKTFEQHVFVGPVKNNKQHQALVKHEIWLVEGNHCASDIRSKAVLVPKDNKDRKYLINSQRGYIAARDSQLSNITKELSKACEEKGIKVERVHFSYFVKDRAGKEKYSEIISFVDGFFGFSKNRRGNFSEYIFNDQPLGPSGHFIVSLDHQINPGYVRSQIFKVCPSIRAWADSLEDQDSYRLYADDVFLNFFDTSFTEANSRQQANFGKLIRFCNSAGSPSDRKINGEPVLPNKYKHLSLSIEREAKLKVVEGRRHGFEVKHNMRSNGAAWTDLGDLISDLDTLDESLFSEDEWESITESLNKNASEIAEMVTNASLKRLGMMSDHYLSLIGYRQLEENVNKSKSLKYISLDSSLRDKVYEQHHSAAAKAFNRAINSMNNLPKSLASVQTSKNIHLTAKVNLAHYKDVKLYSEQEQKLESLRVELLKTQYEAIAKRASEIKTLRELAKFQSDFFQDNELSPDAKPDIQTILSKAEESIKAHIREEEIRYFMSRYYTPFEETRLTQNGKFNTEGNLPAPNSDALFKVFYRVVNSYWKPLGYGQYIRDNQTISMPVSFFGFSMRADTTVNKLNLKTCKRKSSREFECNYELSYRVRPVHENATLAEGLNRLSFFTKGIMAKYESGRKRFFTHTFAFTENGWWSEDMAGAYQEDQSRMNHIQASWQASKPKIKTCLSYKGLEFSCW